MLSLSLSVCALRVIASARARDRERSLVDRQTRSSRFEIGLVREGCGRDVDVVLRGWLEVVVVVYAAAHSLRSRFASRRTARKALASGRCRQCRTQVRSTQFTGGR